MTAVNLAADHAAFKHRKSCLHKENECGADCDLQNVEVGLQ